jgi:hypothetical protein
MVEQLVNRRPYRQTKEAATERVYASRISSAMLIRDKRTSSATTTAAVLAPATMAAAPARACAGAAGCGGGSGIFQN